LDDDNDLMSNTLGVNDDSEVINDLSPMQDDDNDLDDDDDNDLDDDDDDDDDSILGDLSELEDEE
jgi:hypothetical protein